MPARKRPPEDAALLAGVLAAPRDDLPRLVYADWLDDRGDPRGAYLRAEVELAGRHPRTPEAALLRDRLRRLRAKLPADWLAALDRPDVSRADPTPFRAEWWGPVLPGYRQTARSRVTEYGGLFAWEYAGLPPLPPEAHDPYFDWLPDRPGPRPSHTAALRQLADRAKRLKLKLPPAFVEFFQHRTSDWPGDDEGFRLPDRVEWFPAADDGHLLRFLGEPYDDTGWCLFLAPGGYHCVVASDRLAEPDGGAIEERHGLTVADVRFVAPSFETFLYRRWREAGLVRKLSTGATAFDPAERAYLEHYRRG